MYLTHFVGHKHLPPLRIDRAVEKKFIQPTKVFAQRTDQGIISVPEGGGDSMKHEDVEGLQHPDHGMANVARPGPHRAHRPQGPPCKCMLVFLVVFLYTVLLVCRCLHIPSCLRNEWNTSYLYHSPEELHCHCCLAKA